MNNNMITRELNRISKYYDVVLNNFKKVVEELNLTNPIEIYQLYIDMLYNGLLSRTDEYEYFDKKSLLLDFKGLYGIDVLNGRGVCRHTSALLKDIYDKLDIQSEVLPVYLKDNKKRNIISGNHVVNIASNSTRSYILDPTNIYLWELHDKKELTTIKDGIIDEAKISNWIDIADYNSNNLQALKNIRKMLIRNTKLSPYDAYKTSNVDRLFVDNPDYFEEFKKNNLDYYIEITDRLKKVKRRIKK